MKHYRCTWAQAEPDQPDWMACKVTEDGHVIRLIEHFAVGWTDYRDAAREDCVSLSNRAFDPSELALDEALTLEEIAPEAFEALWRASEA